MAGTGASVQWNVLQRFRLQGECVCNVYTCLHKHTHTIMRMCIHTQNELTALSQVNDSVYFPNVDYYKSTIQLKVQEFFKENIQDSLKQLENYIIDFFVAPEKVCFYAVTVGLLLIKAHPLIFIRYM